MVIIVVQARIDGILVDGVPLTQHGQRRGTQTLVGILERLVVIALEEVEACCKGIGGILVEVIGRHLELGVVDEADTLQQVLLDEVVGLLDVMQVVRGAVVDMHHRLRLGHVGYTHVLRTPGLVLVSLGKHVDEDEVQIGTQHMGLTPGMRQFRVCFGILAQFLHGLNGVVTY